MASVDLVGIFASAILPVVAIAAIGFLLGRYMEIDAGPLNTVTVYVLAPALVFHSLAVSELTYDTFARLTVALLAFTATMLAITEGIARLRGEQEPLLSALLLVAVFPNVGNVGIPVSDFAFGEVGRQTAVLLMSVQSVVLYTVGVYITSRSGGTSGLAGVRRVFYLPLVYAVAAAFALRALDAVPPADSASMEAIGLVGESSIPLMLLILGIQIGTTDYAAALSSAWLGTVLKLGLAPIVGLGVALVVGFEDPTVARVFVLETAMPVAVTPIILIVEFAGDRRARGISVPAYVSTCVLVTTLLSIPILTLLIAVLQSGILI